MEHPGLSLFQGGDGSIHVDGRAAEEEAEEIIDRNRRENECVFREYKNAVRAVQSPPTFNCTCNHHHNHDPKPLTPSISYSRLAQNLKNAFDDLMEDDDETLDISIQSQAVEQDRYKATNNYHFDAAAENIPTNNDSLIHRLKMELQSKINELQYLNQVGNPAYSPARSDTGTTSHPQVLTEERQQSERQVGDLTKRLALCEAGRERMEMIKNQTHELLVESKTKMSDFEDLVTKLKERNQKLEVEKGDLSVELESARVMLNDAEMKCHMMQKEIGRGGGANSSRSQDATFKQLTERNNAQVQMMQQQIDNFRYNLEARDVEVRTLEAKYSDLQKTRERMLIEKSETINELAERLERAQRQFQEVLSNQSVSQQTEKTEVQRTVAENEQLRNKIAALEQHNEDLQKTTDGLLKQLDSHQKNRNDFANVMESTPHLRKKPHLAMQGLEETDALVKEVTMLKREVADKSTEIKNLIITENDLRQRLEAMTGVGGGCEACRGTRSQLDELVSMNKNLTDANAELQEMNKRIVETQEADNRMVVQKMQELKVLQQVIAEQKQQVDTLEREKEEMSEERQKMKEITDNSLKCMEQMRQATQMEVKNMQLQNDCMGYLKNLKGLRAASQLIDGLNEERSTTTSTNTSPNSKKKKTYCDRSVMVSTPSDLSTCVCTAESRSSQLTSPQRTAIIEEYAKLSAVEIKRVEDKYRQELVSAQEDLAECQQQLMALSRTYANDTNIFKEAILAEREEHDRLLAEKEAEVEELQARVAQLEQQSERNVREDELLDSLESELKKKQEEIDEERHSMQIWRNQWKEERKQLLTIEDHLKKEMAVLRDNWKSAKSTAANYKKYTEEKDKFIDREIERMRMQYEGVIEKLRAKCRKMEQKRGAGQGGDF